MTDAEWRISHPLAAYGYRRPPGRLWRLKRLHRAWMATHDIWLIVTGRMTLHKAWQAGLNDGTRQEYQRCVVNGGR